MTSSKYRYLNEKLGAAVRTLLIPRNNARAIARAMQQIQPAARDLTIEDDGVAEGWRKLLLDTIEGGDTWKAAAESMTEFEQRDFATTTWQLWAWTHREVWRSSS